MERITNLGMDPDPIDAVLVSGAKRPGTPPHLKIRPFVQGAAEHWRAAPNGTNSGALLHGSGRRWNSPFPKR